MSSSLFPDVNVWLALTHERHAHHTAAARWFAGSDAPTFFCRFTQLGLLRLLTNEQVMGPDLLNQRRAWQAYHRWFEDNRIGFHAEPESTSFERLFQALGTRSRPSTKLWADAYLAAFAQTTGLTLVTFDQGLRAMTSTSLQVLSP